MKLSSVRGYPFPYGPATFPPSSILSIATSFLLNSFGAGGRNKSSSVRMKTSYVTAVTFFTMGGCYG
jgi:hypothetical protein